MEDDLVDLQKTVARHDALWEKHSGEMSRLYQTLDRLVQSVSEIEKRMSALAVKMSVITGVLVAAGHVIAKWFIR